MSTPPTPIVRLPPALAFAFAVLAVPALVAAQQDFSSVEIGTTEVAPGIYMLTGSGGNIGVSVGADGVIVIDDQYAPLTDKILAAIRAISAEPLRFVLNTHWHGDHTGGNENMGRAGALIVAHDNVRERLSVDQVLDRFGQISETPAAPEGAWPVVTFDRTVTFHVNGEEVHAFHVPNAHTDGDAIIHFRSANVIHMGDTYFNGRFPFVDTGSGGSIDGAIAAHDRVLDIADADTRIIPGHGALSNANELREARRMLQTVRDRVAAGVAQGRSLEQITGMNPGAEWEEGSEASPGQVRLIQAILASLP